MQQPRDLEPREVTLSRPFHAYNCYRNVFRLSLFKKQQNRSGNIVSPIEELKAFKTRIQIEI